MFRIVIIFLFLLVSFLGNSQNYYWIGFTDKSNSQFSINNPEEFLSERAIQRRQKQGIAVDELDLPVSRQYIDAVVNLGAKLIHSSRWLNGITVLCDSSDFVNQLEAFSFVNEIQLTKGNLVLTKSVKNKFQENYTSVNDLDIDTTLYGASVYQIGQLKGQYLHNNGFKGEGIQIAILDAGFFKADVLPAFDSLWVNGRILGTKDFVNDTSNIFDQHYHGMAVLSIMGGNVPGELIGTAPEASYWLIRSEDAASEFLIEEDNWVAAAEFADSVGVDIINSSLGYFLFDDSTMNHSYTDMDGQTTRVSRAANIAASRGILVVASAGNEGNNLWKYIIAPADGDNVLAVAATDRQNEAAFFTSYGPASDGDVKPNVAAIGYNTVLQRNDGTINTGSGTSFSGPVIAGMAACLWQANQGMKALKIKEIIEKSAHLYNSPDSLLGYGIPDFKLADQVLKLSGSQSVTENRNFVAFPNPFSDRLLIFCDVKNQDNELKIRIVDVSGRIQKEYFKYPGSIIQIDGLSELSKGIYSLLITSGENTSVIKLVK